MVVVSSSQSKLPASTRTRDGEGSTAKDFDNDKIHYDQVRVSLFILLMVLDGFLFLPENLSKLGYGRWAISRTVKRLISLGIVDPSGNRFSESMIALLREYISKGKRFVDARGLAVFAFDVYRMENWTDPDIDRFVSKFGESLTKTKKKKAASPEELALLKKFRNDAA